jgi:hypothetical protein
VAPKHQILIDESERILNEYTAYLIERLTPKNDGCIEPRPSEYVKAHREFINDPFRLILIRNLADIRSLVEIPRWLVKGNPKSLEGNQP